jgi:hypothetical protein
VAAPGAYGANDVYKNPYQSYPPSCLSDGLPLYPYDSARGVTVNISLLGDPAQCLQGGNASECNYAEGDSLKVWRVPCSNNTSAVLFEIDRPVNLEGSTSLYPTLPAISVTQGNVSLYVRYADDPNTFYTTTYANQPLVYSDVFVLENFYGGSTQLDYDQAFQLVIDNFTGQTSSNPVRISLGAYNPASYPVAALPISGYLSTNWFDPAHNGEGILTQIYDNGDHATRTFTAAWYTFDKSGLPFWLYAQGSLNIGDRSISNVKTYYSTNGGFAGAFGANSTFLQWGTTSFSFPDCQHLTFSYNGQTDAQTNGPSGSGTRTWIRLANINSLVCE